MPDPSSPLIAEAFEATGYDNSGWTAQDDAGVAVIDPDYTATVLHGTQSLRIKTSVAGNGRVFKDFTAGNERWAYFLFRPVSVTDAWKIFSFWNSGSEEICNIYLLSTNVLRVTHGTITADTVGTMSDGTTYHVWVHYNNSGDISDVGFSTDGIRPTSGNNFAQVTTGDAITNATTVVLGGGASNFSEEGLFDRLFVDDVQIDDMIAGVAINIPAGSWLAVGQIQDIAQAMANDAKIVIRRS